MLIVPTEGGIFIYVLIYTYHMKWIEDGLYDEDIAVSFKGHIQSTSRVAHMSAGRP